MAEIINLRRARKRKARAEKDAKAAENRTAFGVTKKERSLESAREELRERMLDSHKLKDETPE